MVFAKRSFVGDQDGSQLTVERHYDTMIVLVINNNAEEH